MCRSYLDILSSFKTISFQVQVREHNMKHPLNTYASISIWSFCKFSEATLKTNEICNHHKFLGVFIKCSIFWTLCVEAIKISQDVRIHPARVFLETYAELPGSSYGISNSLWRTKRDDTLQKHFWNRRKHEFGS